jgi:hypothetical protein
VPNPLTHQLEEKEKINNILTSCHIDIFLGCKVKTFNDMSIFFSRKYLLGVVGGGRTRRAIFKNSAKNNQSFVDQSDRWRETVK